MLAALGLSRRDRLAVILQNRLEMATLHWACQFVGIIVTPLNWRIKAEELDYCLGDADAGAIVFDEVGRRRGRRCGGGAPTAADRDWRRRRRYLPLRGIGWRRERPCAAGRARGSVTAALHLGHDRAAEDMRSLKSEDI
jgi:hypothetical protein